MSKKILSLVLFLMSVLAVSCSNAGKTGSGDNNSGNGGSGTGGDGGTTTQGIEKYAGTWTATFDNGMTTYDIIIDTDGTVTIKDHSGKQIKAENIQGSGNKYTMSVQHSSTVDSSIVTITFESDNSGIIYDDFIGEGTITKNN